MPYAFTILTPTFNRAHTLPRAYESLKAQSLRDFEWLIVDDGSTDDTRPLVASWQREGFLPIRYRYQANSGKHVALNRGVCELDSEFCAILDSDDSFLPHALERYRHYWTTIPEEKRPGFAGVTALCADPQGRIIGTKFPHDPFDSNTLESQIVHGVRGDKKGMLRSDVLKAFPFPAFPDEKFLAESVVWHRISQEYQTRYVNEVLVTMDYQEGGLNALARSHLRQNPKGASLYYLELLRVPQRFPFKERAKQQASYARYALHAGSTLPQVCKQLVPTSIWALAASYLGALLYAWDRLRSGLGRQSSQRSRAT